MMFPDSENVEANLIGGLNAAQEVAQGVSCLNAVIDVRGNETDNSDFHDLFNDR